MQSRSVDPRDPEWETSSPRCRVYFHEADGASDEYEIADAHDVEEVLAWAEAERGERTFVLFACVDRHGLGLVRLRGYDPDDNARHPR